jgi:hypothetical protein
VNHPKFLQQRLGISSGLEPFWIDGLIPTGRHEENEQRGEENPEKQVQSADEFHGRIRAA